jgi:phospholipid/cholesterol/gamma-HCH transport system permease protein
MSPECAVQTSQDEDGLCFTFLGSWTVHVEPCNLPDFNTILTPHIRNISFDTRHLKKWDSRLLVELSRITELANKRSIPIDFKGLPTGVQKLLTLTHKKSLSPPEKSVHDSRLLELIGTHTLNTLSQTREILAFIGEILLSYVRFFTGRARFLKKDLMFFLYDCGPGALPIVALISFLVGFTLAFIGAVQLKMFGADIYVANLVGLTMTREMGPMMAAIIMAGRTGSSYAAQLGTMQVNEEVDALQTMGLNPMDFLVLPRLTALILMMPLLAICADFIGIAGGFFIGIFSLDISPILYYQQTIKAVHLNHFLVGMIKACVFGYIVAFCGCLKGMHCGRSADAVGKATTSSVVMAIVCIVITDAGFTFFFNIIGV